MKITKAARDFRRRLLIEGARYLYMRLPLTRSTLIGRGILQSIIEFLDNILDGLRGRRVIDEVGCMHE